MENKEFEIFKRVIHKRSHWKWFDTDRTIPEALLIDIMETAQRAPSSFNTQPYNAIIVRDPKYKLALSKGMIGDNNKNTVLTADTSAVFLADVAVVDNIPKIQELWKSNTDAPSDFIENGLPNALKLLSVGFSGLLRIPLAFFVWLMMSLVGLLKETPDYNPIPSWAYRQLGFFVDHFILTATAAGLKCACMEGLSGSEICRQLNIPTKYRVFCVASIGYPKEGVRGRENNSPRFCRQDIYHQNLFGNRF